MRLAFFVHEAIRAMRRNAAPSFAALATVLVTMLVVGVFIPAVEVTNDAANTVRGRLIVERGRRIRDEAQADRRRVGKGPGAPCGRAAWPVGGQRGHGTSR